jgi:hypothetical protein
LISWALKLLMVVVSGVQWCDSHFPIERWTEMDLLQTSCSTSYFSLPRWCPMPCWAVVWKIVGIAWLHLVGVFFCYLYPCWGNTGLIVLFILLSCNYLHSRFSLTVRRRSRSDPLVKLRRSCCNSRLKLFRFRQVKNANLLSLFPK